ncbi:MAG: hypothetical protein N3G77_00880 [Nitrososphaeria archaeon]|nr:hypothetical protein [Nitrososphaeria archaeon]
MLTQPLPIITWLLITSIIIVVYLIALLLTREKKTSERIHLRDSVVEAPTIEEESSSLELESLTRREASREDRVLKSIELKEPLERGRSEEGKRLSDVKIEESRMKDEVVGEGVEEPELEILLDDLEMVKPDDLTETAEELKREISRLKRILEGGE